MKLCKDCKWYRHEEAGRYRHRCARNMLGVSAMVLVTGEDGTYPSWCDLERCYGWFQARVENTCGKEGRWWEPK